MELFSASNFSFTNFLNIKKQTLAYAYNKIKTFWNSNLSRQQTFFSYLRKKNWQERKNYLNWRAQNSRLQSNFLNLERIGLRSSRPVTWVWQSHSLHPSGKLASPLHPTHTHIHSSVCELMCVCVTPLIESPSGVIEGNLGNDSLMCCL